MRTVRGLRATKRESLIFADLNCDFTDLFPDQDDTARNEPDENFVNRLETPLALEADPCAANKEIVRARGVRRPTSREAIRVIAVQNP